MRQTYDKMKGLKAVSTGVSYMLLCMHIIYFLFFLYIKAYIMVYVNIFSIATYIGCAMLNARGKVELTFEASYVEVWIHMLLATCCMGWEFGYQSYFFPLMVPVLFILYANNQRKTKMICFMLNIICIAVFAMAKVYTDSFGVVYGGYSDMLMATVYMINAVCAFSLIMIYVWIFMEIVLKTEDSLKDTADYDGLTGIYNRNRIEYLLRHMMHRAQDEQMQVYACMLDVDDFKKFNDDYGHNMGDEVLKKVANILKNVAGENAGNTFVGRWGGEEFLMIELNREKSSEFFNRVEKARKAIGNLTIENMDRHITITAGISCDTGECRLEELIAKADKKLYEGKTKGKNCTIY